jgi:ribosomal protein S18 acetylase RimI-like enzyme
MTVRYRRATPADADQLAELRAVMMESITGRSYRSTEEWWIAARDWFERELADPHVAMFVADDDGALISCALGIIRRMPALPRNPGGLVGSVSNVATRVERRRQGHARRVLEPLLEWLDSSGVGYTELNATHDGVDLYLALGFEQHHEPHLRRPRPSASV